MEIEILCQRGQPTPAIGLPKGLRKANRPFDPASAPDAEPAPADAEALADFNRELQAAINAEFGSQPF
jgi:hypothetical protein